MQRRSGSVPPPPMHPDEIAQQRAADFRRYASMPPDQSDYAGLVHRDGMLRENYIPASEVKELQRLEYLLNRIRASHD